MDNYVLIVRKEKKEKNTLHVVEKKKANKRRNMGEKDREREKKRPKKKQSCSYTSDTYHLLQQNVRKKEKTVKNWRYRWKERERERERKMYNRKK